MHFKCIIVFHKLGLFVIDTGVKIKYVQCVLGYFSYEISIHERIELDTKVLSIESKSNVYDMQHLEFVYLLMNLYV